MRTAVPVHGSESPALHQFIGGLLARDERSAGSVVTARRRPVLQNQVSELVGHDAVDFGLRDNLELGREIEKVFDPAKVLPPFAHRPGDLGIRSEYHDLSVDTLEVRGPDFLGYCAQRAPRFRPGGAFGPPIPILSLKSGLEFIPSRPHRPPLGASPSSSAAAKQCANAAGLRRDRADHAGVSEPLIDFEGDGLRRPRARAFALACGVVPQTSFHDML